MVKRTLMLATALLLTVAMGCTSVQRWAAGGAAAGAAVGGVWAAHAGLLNAGEGAAVGAAAGGLAGALIGDMLEEKTEAPEYPDLRQKNDSLKAQLAARDQELAAARQRIADLEKELEALRKGAAIRSAEFTIAADVLFKSGKASLSDEGRQRLDAAIAQIQEKHKGQFIMIEGHTDSQPIKASGWKSNWELGSARGLTVLHYLEEKGVDPAQLSAGSFSMYQPVATNDTPEGRQQNRRAVIVVYANWPKPVVK